MFLFIYLKYWLQQNSSVNFVACRHLNSLYQRTFQLPMNLLTPPTVRQLFWWIFFVLFCLFHQPLWHSWWSEASGWYGTLHGHCSSARCGPQSCLQQHRGWTQLLRWDWLLLLSWRFQRETLALGQSTLQLLQVRQFWNNEYNWTALVF